MLNQQRMPSNNNEPATSSGFHTRPGHRRLSSKSRLHALSPIKVPKKDERGRHEMQRVRTISDMYVDEESGEV